MTKYRCHSMKVRTDLIETGLYIFKNWIVKLLDELEKEGYDEISSIHVIIKSFILFQIIGRTNPIFGQKLIQKETGEIYFKT
jgi:hypothetical protein